MHTLSPDRLRINEHAINTLRKLFARFGSLTLGEHCSQQEHARQCATLAQLQGSERSLICAAFLHDIGHLQALDANIPGTGAEGHPDHDRIGAQLLRELGFSAAVYQPVAKHVEAKRYLAGDEAEYQDKLSRTSENSLNIQGGAMCAVARGEFLQSPYAREAIQLRRWDEGGKQQELEIPGVEYWLTLCLEEL
ncbi:HD domain-containing protein [Microbulbifer sp. ALW1]|uniref:HD domain-containing protein n=1 Tax=Microbulbifer sp. (strain ALW1) TaxID=1516059 RepID=UPI00135B1793|nr:HD domain-containing protein [Microbulbifer sp. ALW1]